MNITSCPRCGGRVRSVSIGWKCENCNGFIDMQGEFHQHKEEPFMPPMTNADRIRDMSDEELLDFMKKSVANAYMCKIMRTEPMFLTLEWLQRQAEEDT